MINKILYTMQIEPIITNGQSGSAGKYLTLGDGQQVTDINFYIIDNQQKMILSNNGTPVTGYDEIKFKNFLVTNNIFSSVGTSSFTCIIDSADGYNFGNPICNLIRENDIFHLYYDSPSNNNPVQLMVGTIENVHIRYNLRDGCVITFNVGYLPNILARSQLVQTQSQQQITGTTLTSYAPQQVIFGNFLNELLSETYITQTAGNILYFGGVTNGANETIAQGQATYNNPLSTTGSAINAQSYVFAVTPPTDTKLNVILQVLYPYQRVFYVNENGDLIIAPLTTYFDSTENWVIDIDGNSDAISLLDIEVSKNTAIIKNRAYCALNQSFIEYQNVSNTSVNPTNSGVAIATPPQNLFPRAYDMVKSGLGLQTDFSVQGLDANALLQNSGILNTSIAVGNMQLTGVKIVLNISNQNDGITSNTPQDSLKYLMSLYAGRKLAESLVNDLLVDVAMPTINTYSDDLNRFRKIPLNQTITMPPVSNSNFDGQQQMFCYGFALSFDMNNGSITTLNLTKPYTYTAFWADSLISI